MTDKIKNQKGITLIALIVTIIVLIILAAVGISMLLGENGITEKARWSKTVTEFERIDEEKKLYLTEKQINEYGKVPKRIQKFSFQSLFTNISYASDSAKPNDAIYPIIQGDDGKVNIDRVEYTLQKTIRNLELKGNQKRLRDPRYVNLRKVDLVLLGETKVEREYVINVAEKGNGELYWLNKVPYQGLAWHTPRAKDGVDENAEESDYAIYYLPEEGKEEGMYTQDIPNNNSGTITLESIDVISEKNSNFEPEGKLFAHWVDVTDNYEKDDDEEEEEATGNDENSTENTTRKTYKNGDTIDLTGTNIWLEAVWEIGVTLNPNGGTIEGQEPNKTKTIGVIEGKEYGAELDKEPTRTGYTFTGWYTKKDGEDEEKYKITSSSSYNPNDLTNSTLYAHWVDDIKPETFTISVDDLTSEGFTMNLSRVEDYGSKVKEVIYYVSDESPTLNTVNASSQSENMVTGLTKDMTKYVWAEITDYATNTRKSTNYVEVWTGHTHSTEDGVCFEWVTNRFTQGVKNKEKSSETTIKKWTCGGCSKVLASDQCVTWTTSYDSWVNEDLHVLFAHAKNSSGILSDWHKADWTYQSNIRTSTGVYVFRCPSCDRNGYDRYWNGTSGFWAEFACEHLVKTWPCTKSLSVVCKNYNFPTT